MASEDVFVGIDVSKDRLDVHLLPLGVGFSVSNEAVGYAALIARLRPLRMKPSDHGVLSPAVGQRQAAQGGAGGLHAQDAGDAQWPDAR